MGATESTAYDVKKFTDRAFMVQYGTITLGATEGPPSIKPEITTEDIICNQSQGRVIKKLVKKINYVITAKFMQPDTVLKQVFGLRTYTTANLGTDLLDTKNVKDLVLTAIGDATETTVYTFHACTAIVTSYDLDGEKLHGVEVEFRTSDNGDTNGNILTVAGDAGTTGGGGDDPDPDPDPDNGGGGDGE